jgi:hypothetical protein
VTDLGIIWTIVSIRKPCGLRIRNLAQLTRYVTVNHARCALNYADLQTGVLRFDKDFMEMKTIESFSGVLASCIDVN